MTSTAPAGSLRRDAWTMTLIALGHYFSHVMQLVLPPLFPILHSEFGVSFTALGLVVTVFYVASGAGQAVAGVLVDRYGAHRLLLLGLLMLSVGIGLCGFVPTYWMLLPLALLAGLGNAVFHPADLSILSLRVSPRRHGRAYAVHVLGGSAGYATSPVVMTVVATVYGDWRIALMGWGLFGLAITAFLYLNRAYLVCEARHAPVRAAGEPQRGGSFAALTSPIIMMGFAYFALTSFSSQGVQAFGISAFTAGYGLSLAMATAAVVAYLVGTATGIVAGGVLADRTTQHHRVAMGGMIAGTVTLGLTAAVSGGPVVPLLLLAGISYGITSPSRDVIVRQAAAGAGLGSTFGFVYAGFDLGSSTAPLLFGALLDHGAPHGVFVAAAIATAIAAPTVLQVRRRIKAPSPAAAAAD